MKNKKNDILQVVDEMKVLYMGFMIGSSIVLLGSAQLYPADYHYRIVLNWFEVKVCFMGALLASYIAYLCGQMYIDLHSTANGVRKEILYQFGLALLSCISILIFMYLLVDWLSKCQYEVLSPEIGIQWSIWEYHGQRILNCIMVDTLIDMIILRHLRLSYGGRLPKLGKLAIMNEWMTADNVELVLLRQENRKKQALQTYLIKRRQDKMRKFNNKGTHKWMQS